MPNTRTVTKRYECGAPPALFGEWEDVPQELRDKIPRGLPCDGGGVPGTWCERGCAWEVRAVTVSDERETP